MRPNAPQVAHLNIQFFGASETFIYFYLRALERYRPYCVSLHPVVNLDRFPFPGSDLMEISRPRLGSPKWLWRALWNHGAGIRWDRLEPAAPLRARRARLIHAHYGPTGWWALALRKSLRIPLVTSFYGFDTAPVIATEPPSWARRRQRLFADGECFLVEGPAMRERLLALGCAEEKIRMQRIALPLGDIPFRPPRDPGAGPVRILFSARFVEKKGLLDAVRAVDRLVQERRHIEFRIAGDGPQAPQVKELLRTRRLEGQVRLLGFLDHASHLREMAEADLFLQPSVTAADGDSEGGAPTTLLEAQAVGLPIVSTNHADIPYVVVPGRSALLVPERDPEALAHALRDLIDHPQRWGEMAHAGRAHVESRHDVRREVLQLEAIYDEVAESALRVRGS